MLPANKVVIWWPGLSRQLEDMIQSYCKCVQLKVQRPEPQILPNRPWEVLGTDLLTLKGQTYLFLVVDYRSRYVEVSALLSSQTYCEIIQAQKFVRSMAPSMIQLSW